MNSSNESFIRCQQETDSSLVNKLFIPYIVCVAVNVPASVFASIGNALILVALRRTSSLHAPSKALLSNLALTDLCVGFIIQPLFVSMLLFEIDLGRFPISRFVFYCFAYPPSAVSFWTTTVISVDRLVALYKWRTYHSVITLRRMIVIVITMWILGGIAGITAMLASYFVYMTLSSAIISVCVIVSSSSFFLIFRKLRFVKAQVSPIQEASNSVRDSLNVAKYRKLVSGLWHVCCTLWMSYIPFMLLTISLGVFCRSPWIMAVKEFCFSLILLCSALNPVLYCWRIQEVRRATVKVLRQILCCIA